MGEQLQRGVAAQALGMKRQPADSPAADQPIERSPRVVTGYPRGIGASTHRHPFGQHPGNRRRMFSRFGTIAVDEVLALERHAILNRDAAAKGFDPLDVARGDGFGVIEKPRQTGERNVAIDLLEHIEHAADGFVVSGVQAEWPALFNQVSNHGFQILFHGGWQVGAGLQEVFKVGGGERQHLPGTVVPQEVVALTVVRGTGPVLEVGQFFLGLLSEQVVGDANGELLLLGQLLNDLIVVRVILITAAGIDCTGDTQTIEFAHELTRGVHLIFQRQLRTLGQGRIQNHRVGAGDQHAGGVAVGVPLDFAARRVRRVAGIADHFQRGPVEQRAVVQMQDEYRGIGRSLVQFIEGRQAFFGKLEFVPATHHPHPLRCGRAVSLILEHAQGIDQ